MRGDYPVASEHHTRALALYRQTGDRRGEANALWSLGDVARMRGDYPAASEHFSRALALYRQTGARSGEALVKDSCFRVTRRGCRRSRRSRRFDRVGRGLGG